MKKKLNAILLVDDDEVTNFVHKIVVEKANCAEKVVAIDNGMEALGYLEERANTTDEKTDLIFLDINMPAMNGWEFLAAYKKSQLARAHNAAVVILTSSPNPNDMKRAQEDGLVKAFRQKPLTEDMIKDLVKDSLTN